MWLSRLRTQHSICEDAGLIPGLAQRVKDLALLQAAVLVADVVHIQCCCGCGCDIGLSCSSDKIPSLGTSICGRCGPKNKKKKKRITRDSLKAILVLRPNLGTIKLEPQGLGTVHGDSRPVFPPQTCMKSLVKMQILLL